MADQVTAGFDEFVTVEVKATVPADLIVAAVGVTVTATARETVIENVCAPVTPLESVAVTPKLNVPVVVGVPDVVPDEVRVIPAGNCPDEIAKV